MGGWRHEPDGVGRRVGRPPRHGMDRDARCGCGMGGTLDNSARMDGEARLHCMCPGRRNASCWCGAVNWERRVSSWREAARTGGRRTNRGPAGAFNSGRGCGRRMLGTLPTPGGTHPLRRGAQRATPASPASSVAKPRTVQEGAALTPPLLAGARVAKLTAVGLRVPGLREASEKPPPASAAGLLGCACCACCATPSGAAAPAPSHPM